MSESSKSGDDNHLVISSSKFKFAPNLATVKSEREDEVSRADTPNEAKRGKFSSNNLPMSKGYSTKQDCPTLTINAQSSSGISQP